MPAVLTMTPSPDPTRTPTPPPDCPHRPGSGNLAAASDQEASSAQPLLFDQPFDDAKELFETVGIDADVTRSGTLHGEPQT